MQVHIMAAARDSTTGLQRPARRPLGLQMHDDGDIPEQDHLHAQRAAVQPVREDFRLRLSEVYCVAGGAYSVYGWDSAGACDWNGGG